MIRKLQKKDLDKVMYIWLEANTQAHDFVSKTYWQESYEMAKEMLLHSELYIFEDDADHEIQGFIGLIDSYIGGIFVYNEAQSQGIGKQLLDYAKKFKTRLSLHVYKKNERAIDFYKRENFSINSEKTDKNTNEIEYLMIWES